MIIANGGTDWNYDMLTYNTPYTYAAFGIFPESLLNEYREKGCILRNPFIDPHWVPTD